MKQVDLEPSQGTIRVRLDDVKAPETVQNFLTNVSNGHYHNTEFPRVIKAHHPPAGDLSPAAIPCAIAVIDGGVDLPRRRQSRPDRADDFFVKPASVADTVYQLTVQEKSAWTFELEARPFGETW